MRTSSTSPAAIAKKKFVTASSNADHLSASGNASPPPPYSTAASANAHRSDIRPTVRITTRSTKSSTADIPRCYRPWPAPRTPSANETERSPAAAKGNEATATE